MEPPPCSRSSMEDGPVPLRPPLTGRDSGHVQDLFHEDAQGSQSQTQPWWKVKLFVWEPVLFGTWDGVFTTCMINIFGVVLFLRTGWLVGNTGVCLGMLLVSLVVLVALVTVMSGIGVCERCSVGEGGVYSMISTVLGGRIGGSVGLLYIFGQCVAGAMYITGFSESIAQILGLTSTWVVRGMSVVVLLGLLGINLAGVKWIVRLQLLLLAILAVSTLDFVIGSFSHLDPDHGFVGYSEALLQGNALPDYTPGETFFTVFGVFFPAATGVMAGFNMSSDLQRPEQNIPLGTLAAVCTSWFFYLVFVFLLGAICTRDALRYDFLIAEKVSLVGFLFLLGLYISSLASCMGGLYGAPRILQCIAQERVIPSLSFLGKGKGPNKTPVAAICLTSLLTMAFIFVGQVNILAPIVTINFMLTYSIIDYSYFCVAMSFDLQAKEIKYLPKQLSTHGPRRALLGASPSGYGTALPNQSNGTLLEFTKDMDQILQPQKSEVEKMCTTGGRPSTPGRQALMESFGLELGRNVPSDMGELGSSGMEYSQELGEPDKLEESLQKEATGTQESQLGVEEPHDDRQAETCPWGTTDISCNPKALLDSTDSASKQTCLGPGIQRMPKSFYSRFFNRWIALAGACCSVLIMFVIQWVYALMNILVALLLFFYIGKSSPGLPLGTSARFSLVKWIRATLKNVGRGECTPEDRIVLTPSFSMVGMETQQLTEDNADFASRGRYHHSSYVSADGLTRHLQ
ncbi:solute carrier family 12 member 8 isoform X1 [Brienomyrus brachyistius]|uniref:solute carrier family 12 member 8 isoform X1 n=1 Tax=Brienomyrus brachyistius TaxID=42636 RepID=UPI0020B3DE73|nr:solute carrier family 12 member 8 isoform X1 [Brienomyrus brachyistius]XP_048834195.1 solute carrier family 12 member 8 isoform X1 [Brienomyrus brachyistius]XP_048834196.1 solute carrier family 12 member 8 isoform X1 [Brienomyrus brachyistius]